MNLDGQLQNELIEVNEAVIEDVKRFFQRTVELGFPIEKVVRSSDAPYLWDDQKLIADNASSGFNYRFVAGTNHISEHARGLALDINTKLNPCFHYSAGKETVAPKNATWNPAIAGTLFADHPLVVYMISMGWQWGGNWTPEEDGIVDYQHFEKTI